MEARLEIYLLTGGILTGPARVILWGLAAVIDLATPAVFRRRLTHVRFDPSHPTVLVVGDGRRGAFGVRGLDQAAASPLQMLMFTISLFPRCVPLSSLEKSAGRSSSPT